MRTRFRPPPALRRVVGAALTVTLVSQIAAVPTALASGAADPLPRAYQVDSVVEVADLEFSAPLLAVSADGTTAVHMSPDGDGPSVLRATDFRTGADEVVGLDLEGQPVPRVAAVAVSGNGRTVAFLATGANAAELHLPGTVDPDVSSAIFVRDRLTGATTWVPVPDLGVPASRHVLNGVALSEDGQRLAAEVSLPLPRYAGLNSPNGVLVATLAADAAPAVRIVGPESLVAEDADPVKADPEVRGFALSGDGTVLAVNAYRDGTPVMLRFDAANGDPLPGDRILTSPEQEAWVPNLDRTGRRTALGKAGSGVVVADLAGGPAADVTLAPANPVPYVTGDVVFGPGDPPTDARLSADGSTVAFVRAGALWAQPARVGQPARLASPGLDGRIADPLPGEARYPDAVAAPQLSRDGTVLAFLSASTAFVAPRTDAPQPPHLYRSVPADLPAPTWPEGAALAAEPGTTTVTLSWPAASGAVTAYEVSVDGVAATTVHQPATRAVLSNLTPGATVQIAVVARDTGGRVSAPLTIGVTLREDLPPGDAPLSAVAGPGARVWLRWEPSTASGVTGHRVLRDGVKLADLAAGADTYEDRTVAADRTYRYTVALLRGTEEFPLTRDAAVRTPALAVSEAAWNLPRITGTTYLAPGRAATFALVGAPGFTGSADLTVRTADDPAERVRIELKEKEPGTYTGSWPVPTGVLAVTSAVLHLADGADNTLDRPVSGLPAPVGGLLRMDVTATGGEPAGLRLQVWSDATHSGTLRVLDGNGMVEIPVAPAADHQITTTRTDGLAGTPPRMVAVDPGAAVDVVLAPHAPASLTVTVRGSGAHPMADVPVVLSTPTGPRSGRTDPAGKATFKALDAATEVSVEVQVPDHVRARDGLAASPKRTVTLTQGANSLAVDLAAFPKVTVGGTTKDAQGRPLRATVLIRQDVGGVGVSYRAESATDGTWSAEVFRNVPTVASATRVGAKADEVTVDTADNRPVDFVFPAVSGYVLHPKLTTVLIDGGRTEQVLNYQNTPGFQAFVTVGGTRELIAAPELPIDAPPGTTVTFCADGEWRGMTRACAEVVTGEVPDLALAVELHEIARVTGRVLDPTGAVRVDKTCVTLEGGGSLDGGRVSGGRAVKVTIAGSQLRISAPAAGTYLLSLAPCSGEAWEVRRLVTLTKGQQLDLGDLRLARPGGLIQGLRSGFRVVTGEVQPGKLAHLHADIEYGDPRRAGTARLILPPGVSVPDDGVLRAGQPVAFTREEDAVVVPLPAAPSRTLDVYVRMPEAVGTELPFTMSVTSDQLSEVLGSATVRVGVVTLRATANSVTGRFTASGRAPAGSTVVLYDGGTVIAEADAGDGGIWHAVVDLGTAGDDMAQHVLKAVSTIDGTEMASDPATVVVDPHAGVLESVTMSQAGEVRTFRPVDGVARFPWTWYADKEVTVTARFTGAVVEPRALLGHLDLPLVPVPGQNNVYTAATKTRANEVGDLIIGYQPRRERPLLPVPPEPDPATALFDADDAVLDEPVTDRATVSQQFTVPVTKMGPNARLRFKVTVEPLPDYVPGDADRAAARGSGVPVYGTSFSAGDPLVIRDNGTWSGTAGAIIDLDGLIKKSPDAPLARSLNASGFVTGPARFLFEWAFINATTDDALYSALTGGDKYQALSALMDQANKCRDGDQGQIYRNAVERLMRRAIQLDAYSVLSTAAGLALAPATLGLSVGLWAVTWGFGKALEFPLNNDIDALTREMNSDESCRWPRTGPRDPRSPWQPDAEIEYRFDPSGFVYEGLENRRVAGVTATVLRATSPNGPWQPWDAAAYGDLNPQITDDEGRYGWDVPEGWWKVVFTRDGYLPTESRVMKVLPPHTDVNVNLVRADLADVDQVEADQSGLTVIFTQPMLADQVTERLAVTTPQGDPVGGRWTAVSRRAPVGHPMENASMATTFRFTGEKHTGTVQVLVDELARDHVGRFVAEGRRRTLTVDWRGPDSVPPQVSVTGVAAGGLYHLGAVPAAGCETSDDGSGVATRATVTVIGGTAAGVGQYTATCAGAKDKAGNVAAPVSVTYSVAYVFDGFGRPVDNGGVLNKAKAGQAIPIKWRLTDATGAPVTNLATAPLTVTLIGCGTASKLAQVEEYTSGNSGLQNLGDGNYQVNWKTPKSYADTCQKLRVDLGEGPAVAHTALFKFVA
ncbi:hypothetical protein C1I95_15260 [Micromonospora craterilacus]|uniref:Fibronectin type-III domain-containing protein n=1 Tax=Micromonospora craterilacus TaxID=1655439 RepID=A0A2W2EL60_9ACTN|nr:PxKF domain-containing protein [Micromonospora craterilacus]PZG17549.1 hypothetical protein C1I95_15260 [Micromonospora craterilacus]